MKKFHCDFCGKSESDVAFMVTNGNEDHDVSICNECVDICVEIIDEKRSEKCAINKPNTEVAA